MIDTAGQNDPWFTVAVTCATDTAEVLADALWQLDPPAVEERPGSAPGTVQLLSGFANAATAEQAVAALLALGGDAIESVAVSEVTDDGLDGWREYASVTTAGPFTLVPAWLDTPPAEEQRPPLTLLLDPGPTFGSGSHPTTRLVLGSLADLVTKGARVLDVGCGSGVLAVAAALCGADAVGIDVDPASQAVTEANAARNGVAGKVLFDPRTFQQMAQATREQPDSAPFDLVLANLLSPIIVDLAPELVAMVRPGGHLVVSGLLAARQDPAIGALTRDGSLTLTSQSEEDGWVALTFERLPLDPGSHPTP